MRRYVLYLVGPVNSKQEVFQAAHVSSGLQDENVQDKDFETNLKQDCEILFVQDGDNTMKRYCKSRNYKDLLVAKRNHFDAASNLKRRHLY